MKFVIVCHEKVVRIPLEGNEILQVHGEHTQGVVKTLNEHKGMHRCRLLRREAWGSVEVSVGSTEEGEVVTYLRFIANFSKFVKTLTPLTKRNQKYEWGAEQEEKGRVKLRRVRAMSMTIQSSVKDKILATSSETSKVENAPAEMLRDLDQQMEKRADDAQSEAFKQENVPLVGSEMDEAHASSLKYLSENEIESSWILSLNFQDNSKEWNSGDDQLRFRWMIYLVVLADATESVSGAIRFEYCLASSSGWTKSPVLWAKIRESSLIGPELALETTYKVVLIKEKLKAARDRQKSYVDFRRKPLESEVGDRVLLKVSPWKYVVCFGKKGKLAPRYVGPFEILERIGPVAYRLRLPEELFGVHDTFHVSNLKKCLGNANLHVPLNEIEIDKTLRFVKEPVEIMDREVKSLKRSRIPLVKVCWN
ncbi:hypothetical protein Tco_0146477 [Tanacetum coccineum]